MQQLIQNLRDDGCLKDEALIAAFERIDRADFLPENMRPYAYEDRPLPVGSGQTISQPRVVAFMLELLQPRAGEKILDVGSGSGYQTALLASVVGERGEVVAIERLPELFAFGRNNCEKYGFKNIRFLNGDGTQPVAAAEYFDKIIVAAASEKGVPAALKSQLRIGGRLVIPIGESIFVLRKTAADRFWEKEYPGFLFVPLVSKEERD